MNFDPYKTRRRVVPDITFYTGPIRYMDMVEPYLPDRMLRQFGLQHVKPVDLIAPNRAQRGRRSYKIDYQWTAGFWASPQYHLVPLNI